jgi:threonine dehydratase
MDDFAATALPTAADVAAAAARIAGHAVMTPLFRCPALDARVGGTVLLKAENLQRTGSFKFRGAFNRIAQIDPARRAAGVVAASSGNHAQGVAAAAAALGMPATIVMPADAPAIKIAGTRALGAEVVFYDRARQDRETIARTIATDRGASVIPPFDDPQVIAGQGTVGRELMAQAAALGLTVDDVVVPVGGGGLVAGIGLAVRDAQPAARIYAVEPAGYDDHRRSLAAGRRVANDTAAVAFCDALLARMPGALTWRLNAARLSGAFAVTDDTVRAAMAFAFRELKLVVEPGGAAALAALLSGRHDARGRTVAVILSGGNVDPETFVTALRQTG